MFIGEYSHSIDPKGRLIMPAKYREQLGEEFVVAKGFDKCLYVFTNEDWAKFVAKFDQVPSNRNEFRILKRHFAGGAGLCEVDKQGRILIPANLREYAGLDKDVTLVGVFDKIEIWDKESYDALQGGNDTEEIAIKLEEMGIML